MIRFLQTPGPIKKIVLGGLLTMISVFMVITLVPGFGSTDFFGSGGPARGVVAKVAGTDITSLEVQRQAREMVRQQFPRGGAQASMLLPFFASQAAQQLIQRQALIAEAEHLGLRSTDEAVRDELQHGRYSETFFPGGNFIGQAAYEELLQQHDLTVTQFERSVKEGILIDKLRSLVAGGAMVTDAEIRQKFEKDSAKVKFDYAVLRKDDILKGLHPTDTELKAFYDRNKATYNNSIPEKRKIKYVLIDTAKLQGEAQVSQQELQAYYDQHRDEFRAPEQVNVRQILIKTPLPGSDGKVDQKGVDDAQKKAQDVLKQLKAGAKFSIGPDVRAVVVDKNGNIADYPDGLLCAVETQGMPLLQEKELDYPSNSHLRSQFRAGGLQRACVAARQLERPHVPASLAITIPQGIVENKVFQPPFIVSAESVETGPGGSGSSVQKLASRFIQHRKLLFVN